MRIREVSIVSFSLLASCTGGVGAPPSAPASPSAATVSSGVAESYRHHGGPLSWSAKDVPSESVIAGGPWTLEQSGAGTGNPSAGYCVGGVQQRNPGTERMQPYYFPFTIGQGRHLQGYFDYRPKDDDEAIVAAYSDDAGRSWTFQQEVLELQTTCPADATQTNGGDDGQGHPAVLTVGGASFLYTLDRTAGNVDSAGLVVHALQPTSDAPLAPTPASFDVPLRTAGLLDPDGILGVLPGVTPTTVLYLQKELGADSRFPSSQQCSGKGANHDVVTVRLAQTTDGVSFTDLGAVSGLNDQTDVSATGTRWVGPRGGIVRLAGGRFGMFFSGGNCLDADSDAFHYIGYAESNHGRTWTLVNGMSNPIASIAPVQVNGVTIPATAPVAGATQGWFAGRVYGPTVTLVHGRTVSLTFAGYHTKKPKDAYGDYRSIGRVLLDASEWLPGAIDSDDDE